MPYLVGYITPQDFGATGNGVTDDTAAVQAAINAANTLGAVVFFPEGTYLITPSGSPAVGLTLTGVSSGYQGVTLKGVNNQASTLKKNGAGTLIQLSGPSTSPSTGATHCRFITLESLGVNGNGQTGSVFQCYYSDNITFRDVYVNNNADIILDSAEFWDSRFYNCVFGGSGSATANASTPNVYLRNSAAASGFGSSSGTTNMIVFNGCRWEGFTTGALWVAQGTGGSGGPNSVFVTDCKMESSTINGGPHLSVDSNTRDVYVKHLYCYSGGFNGVYNTPQDVITYSGQNGSLDDILISDGGSATVANGLTVNSTVAGQSTSVRNVTGTYSTNPTSAHFNFGTATGGFDVRNVTSNSGTLFAGTLPNLNSGVTSTVTVANTAALTNLYAPTVPGNQPQVGSVYRVTGFGIYSTTGTPTLGWQLYWGGTNLCTVPNITTPSGISNALFKFEAIISFRTTTTCTAAFTLHFGTSTTTDVATTYVAAPTVVDTVTTSGTSTIAVATQWGTASASNTISLLGGMLEKVV